MERVDEAFRSDFEKRSFQVTKNIEEHLRIVGYENVLHEVAVKAHLNENTLRADLDRFTLRRHAIAHRGDYDLSENRMPVILGPAARDQWLDRKADLGALLAAVVKPFPAPEMKAFEVSALVNSPKNNSVENVRPV